MFLPSASPKHLAWASSYYLPAILANRIARDTGVSTTWIFAAFSISLAISKSLGLRIGLTIDLMGGRGVLAVCCNLILASGLGFLAMLRYFWYKQQIERHSLRAHQAMNLGTCAMITESASA